MAANSVDAENSPFGDTVLASCGLTPGQEITSAAFGWGLGGWGDGP